MGESALKTADRGSIDNVLRQSVIHVDEGKQRSIIEASLVDDFLIEGMQCLAVECPCRNVVGCCWESSGNEWMAKAESPLVEEAKHSDGPAE